MMKSMYCQLGNAKRLEGTICNPSNFLHDDALNCHVRAFAVDFHANGDCPARELTALNSPEPP